MAVVSAIFTYIVTSTNTGISASSLAVSSTALEINRQNRKIDDLRSECALIAGSIDSMLKALETIYKDNEVPSFEYQYQTVKQNHIRGKFARQHSRDKGRSDYEKYIMDLGALNDRIYRQLSRHAKQLPPIVPATTEPDQSMALAMTAPPIVLRQAQQPVDVNPQPTHSRSPLPRSQTYSQEPDISSPEPTPYRHPEDGKVCAGKFQNRRRRNPAQLNDEKGRYPLPSVSPPVAPQTQTPYSNYPEGTCSSSHLSPVTIAPYVSINSGYVTQVNGGNDRFPLPPGAAPYNWSNYGYEAQIDR